MVEDWLDVLLPEDADLLCRDRVHLLVGVVAKYIETQGNMWHVLAMIPSPLRGIFTPLAVSTEGPP